MPGQKIPLARREKEKRQEKEKLLYRTTSKKT
jgi:hypothetical protein